MKSKTNIQAATFHFIAALRDEVQPALCRQFAAAVRVLMQKAEFTFNDFLELTKPNAVMVSLFFEWVDTLKEQRLIFRQNRNSNFPTWHPK